MQYYVLDRIFLIPGYGAADIRGVTAVSAAEQSFLSTVCLTVILLPLIVVITGLLSYVMTCRTLRTAARMTATVQAICRDGDLSRMDQVVSLFPPKE